MWWPLAAGLAVLGMPTYWDVFRTFWTTEYGTHGPVMLALIGWLVWRERSLFKQEQATSSSSRRTGWLLISIGLVAYVLGRSQSVHQLEVLSQLPVLAGVVALFLGNEGLRRLWFPIFLIVFLVPIPGSILDQMLGPLKQWVSQIVDFALYSLGYPIARSGVVLTIGPYSLLIADACSGLNSMLALTGIGLLYVYLAKGRSRTMNLLFLLGLLPIAFLANILRVIVLVLLTYYSGDATGRAFHNHAGFLEIFTAFGFFYLFDLLLKRLASATSAAAT